MKAMVYSRSGEPEMLQIQDIPTPTPGHGEVLIRVRAAALGLFDQLLSGSGDTPGVGTRFMATALRAVGSPLSFEVSGEVAEVGTGVTTLRPGDPVFGPIPSFHGGTAQYAVLSADRVARVPQNISFAQAAALAGSFETAWGAVRTAGVERGKKVLVQGASGGVGLYAAQIARAMGAESVTGVCSTRNQQVARQIGCDHVVDYTQDNVSELEERFDAIILVNGNNPIKTYLNLLAPGGVVVGVGGAKQAMAAMGYAAVSKKVRVYANVLTPEPGYLHHAADLASRGVVKPYIDEVYPVEQTADALKYLRDYHAQGKVVVSVDF